MLNLTAKQESFFRMMRENADLERRGVELLLKRPDFEVFFDALKAEGLFDGERNPPVVQVEKAGFYRAAYWPILDYMLALAKICGERDNRTLSQELLAIIRTISAWKDTEDRPRNNYITNAKFVEILSLLPVESVTEQDLAFIPVWLKVGVGRSPACIMIEDRLLPRLISAASPDGLAKAVSVLKYCFEIEWVDAKEFGKSERLPLMAVEGYTAQQIVTKYAHDLGHRAGKPAVAIFADAVRAVFSVGTRKDYSYIHVPAVEDHAQNHTWREVETCVVVGLRESLLGWCDTDQPAAREYISALLDDDNVMLHRIATYVIGQRWPFLRELYPKLCSLVFFNSGHLHELYHVLQDHFAELPDDEKDRTLQVIRSIPRPSWGKDHDASLRWLQLRWLSAITNKGYAQADQWAQELRSGEPPIVLSEHPDFNTYTQTRMGPGPSPYSDSELTGFAEAGILVEKINSFSEIDTWAGPSLDGLGSSLEHAVQSNPEPFIRTLSMFLNAKRRYQYSLIISLQRAWETDAGQKLLEWGDAWEAMLGFFEALIQADDFWQEQDGGENHRDWVASAIADCLRSGTTNDDRLYPSTLLPRALTIIRSLLEHAEGTEQADEDPMLRALNTPKGRAIEAFFSLSLRSCRISDQEHGNHADQWRVLQPLFDAELNKCQNANFEFSTLCAAYLSQLEYLGREWVRQRILQVFPFDCPANMLCAVGGLGHAAQSRSIYKMLVEFEILDHALDLEITNREIRESLLARITSAYLWGEEALNSSRFVSIFERGTNADLQFIASVFWSVRGSEITGDQRDLIRAFWSKCVARSAGISPPHKDLLSALSRLACFLETADGEDRRLLEAVAPYVYDQHNVYEFVDELSRLVEASPDGVSAVLRNMTELRIPDFDYRDQIRNLLETLMTKGKREEVVFHAERMRTLPGMQEIFDRATRTQ